MCGRKGGGEAVSRVVDWYLLNASFICADDLCICAVLSKTVSQGCINYLSFAIMRT